MCQGHPGCAGQRRGSLSLLPWAGSRRALSRQEGDRALSKQRRGGLTEGFWQCCLNPATSQAALQQFLFLILLPAWRRCPQATPCWPVGVALEGCTEVADCSDEAYPVTQAVCCRTAFAQRSPCRSQFGHAQTAGLNVPLLLSPAWRKSPTRVMVYSYTCTCLSP